MILAYETSTDVCSVAFMNTDGLIFEKRIRGKSVHSDNVFLFTRELMKEHHFEIAELESVIVSNGPGSYTGLRIAASAIKGMLFGTNVDLYAFNTLAGFAQSVVNERYESTIHAIIDARRVHVYHQSFEAEPELNATSEARIITLEKLEELIESDHVLVGTGINRLSDKALTNVTTFGEEHISAVHILELYKSQPKAEIFIKTSLEELDPNYLTSNQVNNSIS